MLQNSRIKSLDVSAVEHLVLDVIPGVRTELLCNILVEIIEIARARECRVVGFYRYPEDNPIGIKALIESKPNSRASIKCVLPMLIECYLDVASSSIHFLRPLMIERSIDWSLISKISCQSLTLDDWDDYVRNDTLCEPFDWTGNLDVIHLLLVADIDVRKTFFYLLASRVFEGNGGTEIHSFLKDDPQRFFSSRNHADELLESRSLKFELGKLDDGLAVWMEACVASLSLYDDLRKLHAFFAMCNQAGFSVSEAALFVYLVLGNET